MMVNLEDLTHCGVVEEWMDVLMEEWMDVLMEEWIDG